MGVLLLRLLCIGLGIVGILVGALQSFASLADQIASMINFLPDAGHSLQCQISLLRGLLHVGLEAGQGVVSIGGILQRIVTLLHCLDGTFVGSLGALQQLNVVGLLGISAARKTLSLGIMNNRVEECVTYRCNSTFARALSVSKSAKSSPLLLDSSLIFLSSSSARSLAATASFFN